jgi:hypothetical protein
VKQLLPLLMLLLCANPVQANTSEDEIEHLIEFVAASGCDFERNGTIHTSEGAAKHMRLKLSNGKRYASTAENFIDRLASGSSWTGKNYYAICDGKRIKSKDWLHRELQDIRAQ